MISDEQLKSSSLTYPHNPPSTK